MTSTSPAGESDSDPDRRLLPQRHREATDEGWNEADQPDDLTRLLAERPPHYDR